MTDYYSLENLPKLSSKRRVKQVSSFDRKEQNGDFGQFLYTESDGTAVLFDEIGYGCIKSMWFAVTSDEAELSFYFDGETIPRYKTPLKAFIKNGVGEITGCGVTYEERGQWSGGDRFCGNIFVPVPFEKSLKITSCGKNDFYYHILFEKYDADMKFDKEKFEPKEAFYNAFCKTEIPKKDVNFVKEVVLDKPYTSVFDSKTGGVITEFTVEIGEDTDISEIQADISFDGDPISYVACPLSHLFAEPCGFTKISTVAASSKKENGKIIFSCFLPMPFWESCNITLVNLSKNEIKLTVKLGIEENRYDKNTTGYFHADYSEGATALFRDWILGEFDGRGNVVGIVQTCKGGQWCEGNEHFYIDGELSPSINGTGTEDLYLGCYWPNVKYDSPVAGCVKNIMDESGEIPPCFDRKAGYYRFFHDVPISFENGIKLAIQHGAVGQTYSEYTSCTFSYRQAVAGMKLTDFIDTESTSSTEFHSYEAQSTEKIHLTSKVEGDRAAPILSRNGLKHRGYVKFKASIIPENKGAVLRILSDLSGEKRNAKVFVDGFPCGALYDAEYNPNSAFGDMDFPIPESLTKEKNSIEITLSGEFNAFEYRIYTKIK